MRFLFVVHKNEEKAEQNSVLFHRLTIKERGLRPNGYFPLMRQPLCICNQFVLNLRTNHCVRIHLIYFKLVGENDFTSGKMDFKSSLTVL